MLAIRLSKVNSEVASTMLLFAFKFPSMLLPPLV
jgi:hypothetical protein